MSDHRASLDQLLSSTDPTQLSQATELVKSLADPALYNYILSDIRLRSNSLYPAGHACIVEHPRYPSWSETTCGFQLLLRMMAGAPPGLAVIHRLQQRCAKIVVHVGMVEPDLSGLLETTDLHIIGHKETLLRPASLQAISALPKLSAVFFKHVRFPSLESLLCLKHLRTIDFVRVPDVTPATVPRELREKVTWNLHLMLMDRPQPDPPGESLLSGWKTLRWKM